MRAGVSVLVDSHEAVRVGDLERNMESRKVVKPKLWFGKERMS